MGKKNRTVVQLLLHLCISLLVDFEMLKQSHVEKIHHFVVYASKYTNICSRIPGESGLQCQGNSTNVIRGLQLIL